MIKRSNTARFTPSPIAVVGCGLAGVTCARRLRDHGLEAVVFDKGRGPGGRLSSRRIGEIAVDHGAPAFNPMSPRFRHAVASWEGAGVAAEWHPRTARARGGAFGPAATSAGYVGCPRMNAIVRHQLGSTPLETGVRVTALKRDGDQWWLVDASRHERGPFQEVVLAMPAQQVVDLVGVPDLIEQALREVVFAPTWTLMVQLARPGAADVDLAIFDDMPLDRAIRSGSRPGRVEAGWWTLHSTTRWASEHLHESRDAIAGHLLRAFSDADLGLPEVIATQRAHLWRYASVTRGLSQAFVRDADLGITACGDFGGLHGIEQAWVSGHDAAEAVAEHRLVGLR